MERPREGHALVGTQFLVRGSWCKGATQHLRCAVGPQGVQGTEFQPTYSAAAPSRPKACTQSSHPYCGTSGKARERAGSRKKASGKAGIRVQQEEEEEEEILFKADAVNEELQDASEGRRRDRTGFCAPRLQAGRDRAPSLRFSSRLQSRLCAVWRLKHRFRTRVYVRGAY